jgi:hypothetical protein
VFAAFAASRTVCTVQYVPGTVCTVAFTSIRTAQSTVQYGAAIWGEYTYVLVLPGRVKLYGTGCISNRVPGTVQYLVLCCTVNAVGTSAVRRTKNYFLAWQNTSSITNHLTWISHDD